jgi:hypothetical protein
LVCNAPIRARLRPRRAVDIGYRHALVNGRPVDEFRAGMTFSLSPPEMKGERAV